MNLNIVFSYDCEGNWGFVDYDDSVLKPEQTGELHQAYRRIIDLHSKFRIPVSLGFVALYVLTPEQRKTFVEERLRSEREQYPNLDQNDGCWNGEENFRLSVKATEENPELFEISSHSLTHLPHNLLSNEECVREFMESKTLLEKQSNAEVQSFIYPRNAVAAPDQCLDIYQSYRNTRASPFARYYELFRAVTGFNFLPQQQESDFIYWRGGIRRRFSDDGWRRLWNKRIGDAKNMASDSANNATNRTIHVWAHPHNFVTDPTMFDRLEWLMQLLNAARQNLSFWKLSETSIDGSVFNT